MYGLLCLSFAACLLISSHGARAAATPPNDSQLQECILRDKDCPADGSLDFKRGRTVIKIVRSLDLPDRCSCDLSVDSCLRGCYYNYQLKAAVLSAVWHALATAADVDAAKQTALQTMETSFKPCLLEGKDCGVLNVSLDPAVLKAGLAKFRILVDLPAECECDIEDDSCARPCFYTVIKKLIENGISFHS